ncbi:hypothetical protein MBLNU230_g2231t1 [Neophaeotheca triangularis]
MPKTTKRSRPASSSTASEPQKKKARIPLGQPLNLTDSNYHAFSTKANPPPAPKGPSTTNTTTPFLDGSPPPTPKRSPRKAPSGVESTEAHLALADREEACRQREQDCNHREKMQELRWDLLNYTGERQDGEGERLAEKEAGLEAKEAELEEKNAALEQFYIDLDARNWEEWRKRWQKVEMREEVVGKREWEFGHEVYAEEMRLWRKNQRVKERLERVLVLVGDTTTEFAMNLGEIKKYQDRLRAEFSGDFDDEVPEVK